MTPALSWTMTISPPLPLLFPLCHRYIHWGSMLWHLYYAWTVLYGHTSVNVCSLVCILVSGSHTLASLPSLGVLPTSLSEP